jgi:flagellar motor switch protein FliN
MSTGLDKSLPEMNMELHKAFGDAPDPFEAQALAAEEALPKPQFNGTQLPGSIMRIPVAVQVVIGSTKLPLSQISELTPGAVIKLDQKLGAPALILVNGREVAKGELFVLEGDGERLGITITEVAASA